MNKKNLAIKLSKLQTIDSPKMEFEQYQTPGEMAAEMVWLAYSRGDVEDKIVCDLGCGNGILGIASLTFGARKVIFVDIDKKAIDTAKTNAKQFKNAKFVFSDISDFNQRCDTTIMNPPFGARNKHYDKKFLEKAFAISNVVYSIHKASTVKFLKKFGKKHGKNSEKIFAKRFPIRNQYLHHTKPVGYTEVVFMRFVSFRD